MKSIALAGMVMAMATIASGNEKAFERTPSGVIEVKTLPATTVLAATEAGTYFKANNTLFRRLFRYIKKHEVPMTVPVQADIEPASMLFFVSEAQAARGLKDDDTVTVRKLPARKVVSAGGRGKYSRANFDKLHQRLEAWLKEHPEHAVAGEPYAIYWNSPFTPGFLRRSEVHVPLADQPSARPSASPIPK